MPSVNETNTLSSVTLSKAIMQGINNMMNASLRSTTRHGSLIAQQCACRLSRHTKRFASQQLHDGKHFKAPFIQPSTAIKQNQAQDDNGRWFWPRPTYSAMEAVVPSHRTPRNTSDKVAYMAVKLMRTTFDKCTGYIHDDGSHPADGTVKPTHMTAKQWLRRIIFLESVAGVPGMVGGMLRHLRSIRRFERDRGWIETLLEEAMNERMHLLTFLAIRQPGIMMRSMIIIAQGIFTNFLFLSYIVSPRTVHRFVGYLEEEAVLTYTKCLKQIDAGELPEWSTQRVPEIAQNYWSLPSDATMRDLVLAVRNDEAKHREVNHTLANCDSDDPCAFSHRLDGDDGRRVIEPKGLRPGGWEREEVLARHEETRSRQI